MIKRLVAFFLSFVLIFISVPSFAVYDPNPKHSKWFHDSIVNDPLTKSAVEVKAQRTYPVTVTNPATGAKDTITKVQRTVVKLGPPVANVGKKLLKGGAQVAVATAVYDILGKSVDWVMDPENNRIKYTDQTSSLPKEEDGYYYSNFEGVRYYSPADICDAYSAFNNIPPLVGSYRSYSFVCKSSSGADVIKFNVFRNNDYVPSNSSQDKYIPIDTVAQKVIDNAAAGDAPSMEVMTNTALDMLEQGLLDTQLESAAQPKQFGANESDPLGGSSPTPDPETDPETDPDSESPTPAPETEPFELPPFCSWATKVCDFIDWYQDPADNSDTEIDLPEPDIEDVDTDIDFGGSCPDDFGFTADFRIFQFEFVLMPFSKFCPLLSTYIKPVLVVLGSYMAILIVGGRRDV